MRYIGILWNTVNDFKEEILNDINKYGTVIHSYELELDSRYDEFVRSLYEFDGIAEWKVNLKLEAMKKTNNTRIVIVFIEIDDSKKEFNDKKGKEVIVNIENLKKYIRTKYSLKIPNYYFDNIFHMTDNKEELLATLQVIEKWYNSIYENYQAISDEDVAVLKRKREKNEN